MADLPETITVCGVELRRVEGSPAGNWARYLSPVHVVSVELERLPLGWASSMTTYSLHPDRVEIVVTRTKLDEALRLLEQKFAEKERERIQVLDWVRRQDG